MMQIDTALYESVNQLAETLMDAAEKDQHNRYFDLYAELEALAEDIKETDKDHPYVLETLGDFTLDDEDAIDVYERALELADALNLPECRASIQLAIADRYLEIGDHEAARNYADETERSLDKVQNEGLRQELAELRRDLGQ